MESSLTSRYTRIMGGLLAGLGFLLSPFSWWNDIVVNIPLAYLMASAATFVFPGYFAMFMILFYWLTNVLGLVLLHRGGQFALGKNANSYSLKSIIKDIFISIIYSIIVGILVMTNILRLPTEYF